MTENSWITLAAQLVHGYGVASGRATHSPYPQGTIALQTPHFLELGLDLRGYYPGTLNLSIAPYDLQLRQPRWTFPLVEWFPNVCETFSFSPCRLVIKEVSVNGLIYYPHPDTKPAHFQDPSIVEVLAPYIGDLDQTSMISLEVKAQEIRIQSPGLTR
ncbi:hypothetical protein [Acaryochloris thomasi]|nr:hypothetical protein [Acaryochloris thomasi]